MSHCPPRHHHHQAATAMFSVVIRLQQPWLGVIACISQFAATKTQQYVCVHFLDRPKQPTCREYYIYIYVARPPAATAKQHVFKQLSDRLEQPRACHIN